MIIKSRATKKRRRVAVKHMTIAHMRRLARRGGIHDWQQMVDSKASAYWPDRCNPIEVQPNSGPEPQEFTKIVKSDERKRESIKLKIKHNKSEFMFDRKEIGSKKLELILCSQIRDGHLYHLCKFKNTDKCQLVESDHANQQWPMQVIHYFQNQLKFPKQIRNH